MNRKTKALPSFIIAIICYINILALLKDKGNIHKKSHRNNPAYASLTESLPLQLRILSPTPLAQSHRVFLGVFFQFMQSRLV